jgi:ketosteroid isomerase-like protein
MPNHDDASPREIIESVFNAIDAGSIEDAVEFFTSDITIHFANIGPLTGPAAFVDLYNQFADMVQGVRHDIHNIWSVVESPDAAVSQATAHYTLVNGHHISLPCCNIFRLSGSLISEYRVFMDITPALSAATATSSM